MSSTLLTVQRPYSALKTALAWVGAFALVSVAAVGVHQYWPSAGAVDADRDAVDAIVAAQAGAAPIAMPMLRATLFAQGRRYDNAEHLVLPNGSVVALSLASNLSGYANVIAVNPNGQTNHIWSGRLQPRQDLFTPGLRLQGTRGTETLRIVFTPDANAAGARAASVVQQLTILQL